MASPDSEASIAEMFLNLEACTLPREAGELSKARGICVDDGMTFDNPAERVVALSGSGIGEVPDQVRRIYAMTGVTKIKPHRHCGKARLVLEQQGVSQPDNEQVDGFAETAARVLASQIGVAVGRTIGFDDGRRTRLVRPPDHHPAKDAIMTLSGRLPHNLIPQNQMRVPAHYNLEGTYLAEDDLRPVAVAEMGLVVSIASGNHGVGIVPEGFRFTALADLSDPTLPAKLDGLEEAFTIVNDALAVRRSHGEPLNEVSLAVVGYGVRTRKSKSIVSFEPITLRSSTK